MESGGFGCGILRFLVCGIVGVWLWNRENVVVEARRLWVGESRGLVLESPWFWFWNRENVVVESRFCSYGIYIYIYIYVSPVM